MLHRIHIVTEGRGLIDITDRVRHFLQKSGHEEGFCHLFIRHTSASLLVNENWDADVQGDLQAFFARLVSDGDPLFQHTAEGPDDMPAHIRSALTATSLAIPFENGQLLLGSWQGIFLWEHRLRGHNREVVVGFS